MKLEYYFFFLAVLVSTPCLKKPIFAESISPSDLSLMEKKEVGGKPSFSHAFPLIRPPSSMAMPPEIEKKETRYRRRSTTMAPPPLIKSRLLQTYYTNSITLPPQLGPNSCLPDC